MSGWDATDGADARPSVSPPRPRAQQVQTTTPVVSEQDTEKWLIGDEVQARSNVCCGIYGYDGTGKSGIAVDCRTPEEKKAGMKVFVFDLDGGCSPLKLLYHNNDPNIIIKNPLKRDELKNVDYEATFSRLKGAMDYIEKNIQTLNVKAVVFDGVDKFLKICEYSMREELSIDAAAGIEYRYWKNRNKKYNDVIEQIKLIDVDRYFITHLKKDQQTNVERPDWQEKTADMLFQKVKCYKETRVEDGHNIVLLKGVVEKCKTNLAFEGKEFLLAKVIQDVVPIADWYGLKFGKDNTIYNGFEQQVEKNNNKKGVKNDSNTNKSWGTG